MSLTIRTACAALVSTTLLLPACAYEDEGLVPESFEQDLNFSYYIDGDMAIADPFHSEIFLASGGSGPGTLFLNFEGGTIHKSGWSQNNAQTDSSFVPAATSVVPSFDHSHWNGSRSAVISKIVAGVAEDFADYGVEITATRPAQGTYTMVMIGGRSADIGMTSNVLGVAPLDGPNWNPNDVGFVFSDTAGGFGYSERHLAHVVSHEIGHTLGLRHLTRVGDIMRPAACHCSQTWGSGQIVDSQESQDEPSLLASIFPQPTQSGADPIGRLDSIDASGIARGWACDTDAPEGSIALQLYIGGIAGSGAELVNASANQSSEGTINDVCGGGTAHRFEKTLPLDQCGQLVHVYGVNSAGSFGSTTQLADSPKSMPACEVPEEPATCGAGDAWIEDGTHDAGETCGKTCSGYHWSWCDYDGNGSTSDGWQFCLSNGWAACSYHPH